MSAAHALLLQVCRNCGQVQYPDREVCGRCLGAHLERRTVDSTGEILGWTRLHASLEALFRPHLPWLVASVRLQAGPVVIVHWAGTEPAVGQAVQVGMLRDPADRSVLVAVPAGDTLPAASDLFDGDS
jgi:uncharacterized OB-fold protein